MTGESVFFFPVVDVGAAPSRAYREGEKSVQSVQRRRNAMAALAIFGRDDFRNRIANRCNARMQPGNSRAIWAISPRYRVPSPRVIGVDVQLIDLRALGAAR